MTGNQIAALIIFSMFIGGVAGSLGMYLFGEPRCKHEYKEIINDCYNNRRTVVHMCLKCGKRKVTKVQ